MRRIRTHVKLRFEVKWATPDIGLKREQMIGGSNQFMEPSPDSGLASFLRSSLLLHVKSRPPIAVSGHSLTPFHPFFSSRHLHRQLQSFQSSLYSPPQSLRATHQPNPLISHSPSSIIFTHSEQAGLTSIHVRGLKAQTISLTLPHYNHSSTDPLIRSTPSLLQQYPTYARIAPTASNLSPRIYLCANLPSRIYPPRRSQDHTWP